MFSSIPADIFHERLFTLFVETVETNIFHLHSVSISWEFDISLVTCILVRINVLIVLWKEGEIGVNVEKCSIPFLFIVGYHLQRIIQIIVVLCFWSWKSLHIWYVALRTSPLQIYTHWLLLYVYKSAHLDQFSCDWFMFQHIFLFLLLEIFSNKRFWRETRQNMIVVTCKCH